MYLAHARGSIVADDPLALAQRRVWDAQKIVAEQKRRIAGLRAAGASTFDAVQVLSAFESNLRLFTEHRDALLSVKRRPTRSQ
jgi:hypothetical protein